MADSLQRIRARRTWRKWACVPDVERIRQALAGAGYAAEPDEVAEMWKAFSASRAACWLGVGEDDLADIVTLLAPHFEETPEP